MGPPLDGPAAHRLDAPPSRFPCRTNPTTRAASLSDHSALRDVAAIHAVVSAGRAAMICMESQVTDDLRVLGSDEGFPPLPSMNLHLLRNPQMTSPITECLAEYILEGFRL